MRRGPVARRGGPRHRHERGRVRHLLHRVDRRRGSRRPADPVAVPRDVDAQSDLLRRRPGRVVGRTERRQSGAGRRLVRRAAAAARLVGAWERTRRMRTLDRYVLREWAKVFFVVMIGFPVLVIVIDFTDKLGQYLGRMSKATVALAYLFAVPEIMFLVLPAAVLFATVFLVGSLGRHSEITAAKASGVSFHRLVRPLYLIAVAASLSGVVLGEIYPVSSNRKEELLGVKQIRSTSSRYNFVYRADGGWVYAIAALQVAVPTMTDLLLEREGRGAEYPTIVIAAQRALYDTAGVKRGRTGHRGGGAQRSGSPNRGTRR